MDHPDDGSYDGCSQDCLMARREINSNTSDVKRHISQRTFLLTTYLHLYPTLSLLIRGPLPSPTVSPGEGRGSIQEMISDHEWGIILTDRFGVE
jgi:hypothetical protein